MPAAETLAIGGVVLSAAVAHFPDVIGEHAVRRLRFVAAHPMLNRLALACGLGDDPLSPLPIFRRPIEGVRFLGPLTAYAAIELSDARLYLAKLSPHTLCHLNQKPRQQQGDRG